MPPLNGTEPSVSESCVGLTIRVFNTRSWADASRFIRKQCELVVDNLRTFRNSLLARMGLMAMERNWSKYSTIATLAVGVPAVALAAAAYFFPSDAAHPVRLDFLSQSISLPLWLAGIVALMFSILVVAVLRLRSLPSPPTQPAFKSYPSLRGTMGRGSYTLPQQALSQKHQ